MEVLTVNNYGLKLAVYTAEVFYRLQLAQNPAITPDIQLIINPSTNPDENAIVVLGLRARMTF